MTSASDLITKARTALVINKPFFGTLTLRLTPVEDPTCETLWTDGKSLGYNPDFVMSLGAVKLQGCLCHEDMHDALGHHARRGLRDAKKWNVACDYVVNALIRKEMTLPAGILYDAQYENLTAEDVYNLLPDDAENGQKADPGQCGEVRDAPPTQNEEKAQGGPAKQKKPGSLTPSEASAAEQEWKEALSQARTAAVKAGKFPAGMAQAVEDVVNPQLPWQEILQRFVRERAKSDYSWIPPSMRHLAQGMVVPALSNTEIGLVALVFDTSMSITARPKVLSEFCEVLSELLSEVCKEVIQIDADAVIHSVRSLTRDDLPLSFKPLGGGGTDFRKPFEYLEEEGIEPACLIYLTDLECDDFPEEPSYPVLWACTERTDSVPFGEVIHLK
jgi:predicted metal-dependent peptidase